MKYMYPSIYCSYTKWGEKTFALRLDLKTCTFSLPKALLWAKMDEVGGPNQMLYDQEVFIP